MEDNEIQYLGHVAPNVSSSSPDISGIRLSVVEGDDDHQNLQFFKSQTNEVIVGRASSTTRKVTSEVGRSALFRCPVISRIHAKIAFGEDGSVAVTDLNSHHGTVVHRHGVRSGPAEPIAPNLAVSLHDGDMITFGKKVAKDDTWVLPITVAIRLLNGNAPSAPTTPAKSKMANRSGRYGCFDSPSSSLGSPSHSVIDVDEAPEELPILRSTPPPNLQQLPPIRGLSLLSRSMPFACDGSSAANMIFNNPWGMLPLHASPSPPLASLDPFIVGEYPPSEGFSSHSSSSSEQFLFTSVPPPGSPSPRLFEPMGKGGDPPVASASAVSGEEEMDMDSESEETTAQPHLHPIELKVQEWREEQALFGEASNDAEKQEADSVGASDPSTAVAVERASLQALDARLTALDEAVVSLRGNILRDHIASRKTQAEHQAQGERVAALGARTDETAALLAALRRRIDEDAAGLRDELIDEIAAVRERVDVADGSLSELSAKIANAADEKMNIQEAVDSAVAEATNASKADVQQRVNTLENLVADMRRICDEMKAMRAEQDAGLGELRALREQVASAQPPAPAPTAETTMQAPTLKRKREVFEENDEMGQLAAATTCRSVKRTRVHKAVAVLGRTAAIATVGAVAAWSALAFA